MMAELASYAAYAHPGPGWDGDGWDGPGWWVLVPIAFWVVVLSAVGYLIYRFSPRRAARTAAERTLAERFARGEIDAEELEQRRSVLRGKG
ncbi:SHOCT domain-containing protein [Phytohabitans sp. ZYX-F-186]|uniref:SHOCT domain-containing protein n=1 Tax=Phytohabitans maris TaxID=3071409 RepID=A0ABU0ZJ86_9ACTN|nr:SHOCT domain-containing protein [Phytohabitans sp. ZYX-F-186]MDQ7907111.1 SHOCT domain-containing protein [Phytohabitans sp. ZYX-F-186]